jgi:hypothetical protein
MAGETGPTAEIANEVSKKLLKWFRWERFPLKDRNFDCLKSDKHARANKKQKHTHPTDVVFSYRDPYLNRRILFNTDLKSYAKSSISGVNVRGALRSLAQTIECARVSGDWKTRYEVDDSDEIRGLLFVYNHDAEFDDGFERYFVPPRRKAQGDDEATSDISGIPLEPGQLIHIIQPRTIAYMQTILNDTNALHMAGTFPRTNYYFYYPDQKLHKVRLERHYRPATVEALCGPYFIVGHDAIQILDENTKEIRQSFGEGFIIYYNRPGRTHSEFMYLFDVLSSCQLLDGEKQIRIRVAHHQPDPAIKNHFRRAIRLFVHDWGFDEYIQSKLDAIDFEVLDIQKQAFSQTKLGWDHE